MEVAMILIAHRGGTDRYPEQSIAAARFSLSEGADLVELDVRYTSDPTVPVICHDANAKRVFGVDKDILDMSLDQFLSLRHLSDPAIGTYTLEVLLAEGIGPFLLHLKCGVPGFPCILDVIHRCHAEDRVVLGIEETDGVALSKENDPSIRILSFMHTEDDLLPFLDTDCEYIRLWEPWLTQERIDLVHSRGKKVWVMSGAHSTVGYTDLANIKRWKDMGVDGVLINEIVKAKDAMRS